MTYYCSDGKRDRRCYGHEEVGSVSKPGVALLGPIGQEGERGIGIL